MNDNVSTCYGVQANPYLLDRLKSFDPAEEKIEPLWVDGFRTLRPPGPLQTFFRGRRETKASAPVLVRGRSGIGRTAAARYILGQYGMAAGAKRLIVPHIEANNDEFAVLKSWLRKVAGALRRSLNDKQKTRVEDILSAEKLDETCILRLEQLLGEINDDFGEGDNSVALGFCIDDPPEKFAGDKLLHALKEMNLAVVIVVHTDLDEDLDQRINTSTDSLLSLFRGLETDGKGWIFPRARLTADDAYILAEGLWRRARADGAPCPVTSNAIQELWTDSALALAEVLQILAIALDEKADRAPEAFWVADALCISGEDLRQIRRIREKGREFSARWNRAGKI